MLWFKYIACWNEVVLIKKYLVALLQAQTCTKLLFIMAES